MILTKKYFQKTNKYRFTVILTARITIFSEANLSTFVKLKQYKTPFLNHS